MVQLHHSPPQTDQVFPSAFQAAEAPVLFSRSYFQSKKKTGAFSTHLFNYCTRFLPPTVSSLSSRRANCGPVVHVAICELLSSVLIQS